MVDPIDAINVGGALDDAGGVNITAGSDHDDTDNNDTADNATTFLTEQFTDAAADDASASSTDVTKLNASSSSTSSDDEEKKDDDSDNASTTTTKSDARSEIGAIDLSAVFSQDIDFSLLIETVKTLHAKMDAQTKLAAALRVEMAAATAAATRAESGLAAAARERHLLEESAATAASAHKAEVKAVTDAVKEQHSHDDEQMRTHAVSSVARSFFAGPPPPPPLSPSPPSLLAFQCDVIIPYFIALTRFVFVRTRGTVVDLQKSGWRRRRSLCFDVCFTLYSHVYTFTQTHTHTLTTQATLVHCCRASKATCNGVVLFVCFNLYSRMHTHLSQTKQTSKTKHRRDLLLSFKRAFSVVVVIVLSYVRTVHPVYPFARSHAHGSHS
jgi:hypothetical protein